MALNVNNAEFIRSAVRPADFPRDGLPQVAFAGRSNVGKSSVINRLLNRKNFARVGAAPGKTTHINYFLIDRSFYLVDLPGYGYARVSRGMQEDWGRMMDSYFAGTQSLLHILHLVDMRHEPGANDVQMQAWIQHNGVPCTVVATKCDKLSRAQQQKAALVLCRTLGVQPWNVQPFSSVTRAGREELLARVGKVLGEEAEV